MTLNRRNFIKGLAGVAVVLSLPFVGRRIYYMKPGEVLDWVNDPSWKEVHMAESCIITNCFLNDCPIIIPAGVENVRIESCRMIIKDRTAIQFLGPASVAAGNLEMIT